jgi:hypothetical protein
MIEGKINTAGHEADALAKKGNDTSGPFSFVPHLP